MIGRPRNRILSGRKISRKAMNLMLLKLTSKAEEFVGQEEL